MPCTVLRIFLLQSSTMYEISSVSTIGYTFDTISGGVKTWRLTHVIVLVYVLCVLPSHLSSLSHRPLYFHPSSLSYSAFFPSLHLTSLSPPHSLQLSFLWPASIIGAAVHYSRMLCDAPSVSQTRSVCTTSSLLDSHYEYEHLTNKQKVQMLNDSLHYNHETWMIPGLWNTPLHCTIHYFVLW